MYELGLLSPHLNHSNNEVHEIVTPSVSQQETLEMHSFSPATKKTIGLTFYSKLKPIAGIGAITCQRQKQYTHLNVLSVV